MGIVPCVPYLPPKYTWYSTLCPLCPAYVLLMSLISLVSLMSPPVSMLPHPTWLSSLSHVHPMIKGVFPVTEVTSPLAGRIQKFLVNWKLLTSDKEVLNIVKGWVSFMGRGRGEPPPLSRGLSGGPLESTFKTTGGPVQLNDQNNRWSCCKFPGPVFP